MFGVEYEVSSTGSRVCILAPQLLGATGKVAEPWEDGALLEDLCCQG